MGQFFAIDQLITNDIEGGAGSYGIFMPMMQSASIFFGLEYLSIIPPAFALSLVFGFILQLYIFTKTKKCID
jgi:hypothetical protein